MLAAVDLQMYFIFKSTSIANNSLVSETLYCPIRCLQNGKSVNYYDAS